MSTDNDTLPEGWTKNYSNSQKKHYWYHAESKTSQWHPPTSEEAKNPLKARKVADQKAREEKKGTGKSAIEHTRPTAAEEERSSKKLRPSEISQTKSKAYKTSTRHRTATSGNGGNPDDVDESKTSIAIIVPFRDLHPEQKRAMHLARFLPHMSEFLGKQVQLGRVKDFHIYIIEQSNDGRKFNRGKLLNIGFDYAKKSRKHDVFIFHDVDLLPGDDLGSWYARFPKTPIHIARCWDRYSNNPKYFGGIVSFSASDMKKINGYPNTFWGWGGEDDEMQKRCEKLGISWEHPPKGTIHDLENMSLKEKLNFLRANKQWKCYVKWEALEEHEKTWKTNGLTDLTYAILSKKALPETNDKGTLLNVDVKLNGEHWTNNKSGVDYTM